MGIYTKCLMSNPVEPYVTHWGESFCILIQTSQESITKGVLHNITPANPLAHLSKIKRPPCDIYMEMSILTNLTEYLCTAEHF